MRLAQIRSARKHAGIACLLVYALLVQTLLSPAALATIRVDINAAQGIICSTSEMPGNMPVPSGDDHHAHSLPCCLPAGRDLSDMPAALASQDIFLVAPVLLSTRRDWERPLSQAPPQSGPLSHYQPRAPPTVMA